MILKLPKLLLIRQKFDTPRLEDIPSKVESELSHTKVKYGIGKGKRIAITVGSRGITNLSLIVKALVKSIKRLGAEPFIVPAMGSHGGGNSRVQLSILESFGITESEMSCPIYSSMETVELGRTSENIPLLIDKYAYNGDGMIILNRVKPHTTLSGSIESGLMKMCLIGLGKKDGARLYHRAISRYGWSKVLNSAGRLFLNKASVLFGVAILENAFDETADIRFLPPESFFEREPLLLSYSKRLMAHLPFDYADLLIVDEMGKDISGTGMDTNITQRKEGLTQNISKVFVRGLSDKTYGNANGIGLADFTTRQVFEKIDLQSLYTNAQTACRTDSCKIPMMLDTDKDAIVTALDIVGIEDFSKAKIMWVKNTSKLEKIYVSDIYSEEIKSCKNLFVIKKNIEFKFDNDDMLLTKNFR